MTVAIATADGFRPLLEARLLVANGSLAADHEAVRRAEAEHAFLLRTRERYEQEVRAGERSAEGLAKFRATLQSEVAERAEAVRAEQARLEGVYRAYEDSAVGAWTTPPSTEPVLDYLQQREVRDVLRAEDPVNRELLVMAAVDEGDRDIVRAALTDRRPPIVLGDAKWQPLLGAEARQRVQDAVVARVMAEGKWQGPSQVAIGLYASVALALEQAADIFAEPATVGAQA